MTVLTTTNKVIWQGNGATTTFSYSFQIPLASEVDLLYTTSAGVQTTIPPSSYTITGVGTVAGGTVTYPTSGSPIPAGSTLTLLRVIPYTQPTSLTGQGGLWPTVIEQQGLDNLEMQIQQLSELIGRCVVGNPADPALNYVLPTAAARAGQNVICDGSGNITTGAPYSGSVNISTAMTPVVQASTTSAALALLGYPGAVFATVAALRLNSSTVIKTAQTLNYATNNDKGGGFFVLNPSDTTSTDNGGNLIVDGAGQRWVLQNTVYDVCQFGADYLGNSDCTTAINNAIGAAEVAGGIVWFRAGNFRINGTLNVTAGGVGLYGSGRYATFLNFSNGASNCLVVQGASFAAQIYGFEMRDLYFNHFSKTGGISVTLKYVNQVNISNIFLSNCWIGWLVQATNTVYIERVLVQGVIGGTNCWGFKFYANPATGERSDYLTTNDFTINCLYSGALGFEWDGSANTWNGNNITALDCYMGMRIFNSASNSTAPTFGEFNNFNVDGAQYCGLSLEAGDSFQFTNGQINNTSGSSGQGSADLQAIRILPDTGVSYTRGIQFANCRIGLAKEGAAYVNAIGVLFSNCSFVAGSTTPSNTYNAVELAGGYNIQINGCTDYEYGSPNNWAYGVRIDAGVNNFMVVNNNLSEGAVTGGISDVSGSVTKVIANNM